MSYVGKPVLRLEDGPLLRGRATFADDVAVKAGTLHAAILRSPHAHAELLAIDAAAALARPGVAAVVTRDDVLRHAEPFMLGLETPLEYHCLAVDRVRYVGEPVAVVLAANRYLAEDALEHIKVEYRSLAAVVDPVGAIEPGAPVLHPKVGSNLIVSRHYRYGDVDQAFADAPRRTELTVRYPRNSIPPLEGYIVVAEHKADGAYDVLSNFQGPFSLQPVMARALKVPGAGLRLRMPPNSGGSFGVKMTLFPYIVLMCVAARVADRPVKWVEDRMEHLAAANSNPGRVTRIEAAFENDGRVTALRFRHWDDHGAYLRAPMPAPTIRSNAFSTGAYAIRHLEVVLDVVATNKCPTGAVRGFGAPQMYFALERIMQRIAVELGKGPLEVIRANLVPAEAFPYRTPAGALFDSGNYTEIVDFAVREGGLEELKRRRAEARRQGRLYGIGYAAVVEPGQSNMGYISTVKTREERERAGPKDGAIAYATVAVDPLGSVCVLAESAPQGQGHQTVLAQIVADQLGLRPEDITVNLELDTQKDGWSIAAGNYSCRFGPSVSSAAHLAARRVRDKIAAIAARQFGAAPEDIEFADGQVYARSRPQQRVKFARMAGIAHWSPGSLPAGMDPGLRETAAWSGATLTPTTDKDEINSMLVYGFGFDFCGVEIDRVTAEVRIDRYVTAHDGGVVLNPGIADGQIRGGFAGAVSAALFEEFVYASDGAFLTGTFADYLVVTAPEMPPLTLLHPPRVHPSPLTLLGAKSLSEGNNNSTPVCIANAVADALGTADISLPIAPRKLCDWVYGDEPPRPAKARTERDRSTADATAGTSA